MVQHVKNNKTRCIIRIKAKNCTIISTDTEKALVNIPHPFLMGGKQSRKSVNFLNLIKGIFKTPKLMSYLVVKYRKPSP